ncbi:MAG: MogA/MoaB family molybdenum cofactor biosynthesis protein [Acidobacteria bacterium]|nr:MogA/MoaB family molybdenum cofactor biosynthesis protein [Acidobacteriota bacterium]
MSHTAHRAAAPRTICCAVVTVSDTRTAETDSGGGAIVELLEQAGHDVAARTIVPDDPDRVRDAVTAGIGAADVDVVITTGGTGITRRDGTYEVVSTLLEKRIDGFGELFRALSFQEIGPAAMLSRACAGLAGGTIVISVPGSEHAVRLAMTRLIVPELGHMVREARR